MAVRFYPASQALTIAQPVPSSFAATLVYFLFHYRSDS